MIIGVTSNVGGGKDAVAQYFINNGFEHLSLSDFLREKLKKSGDDITRKNLYELGNYLRQKFGADVLAKEALRRVVDGKEYVVSSIGTIGEIKKLKSTNNFKLIFVDAPPEIRFNRVKKRKREKDPKTLKEFQKLEDLERNGGGAAYREHDACRKFADIILINDSTLQRLYEKLDNILFDLNKKQKKKWFTLF